MVSRIRIGILVFIACLGGCFLDGAITFNPREVDWSTTNNGLAAYGTWVAAAVALYFSRKAARQASEQTALQVHLEEVRLKQEYLNRALYVVREGFRAAQIFAAAMHDYRERGGPRRPGIRTPDEKAIRSAFEREYIRFHGTLEPTRDVLKSMKEPETLLASISVALTRMRSLYDYLLNQEVPPSEEKLNSMDREGSAPLGVEEAAKQAATAIADRIKNLYEEYRLHSIEQM